MVGEAQMSQCVWKGVFECMCVCVCYVSVYVHLYMFLPGQIMWNNNIVYRSYAEDTQIEIALSPNERCPVDLRCQCIEQVNDWMCQNLLQLNKDKTKMN